MRDGEKKGGEDSGGDRELIGGGVQNKNQRTEVQLDLQEERNEVDKGNEELMRKLEEHAALMRDSTMRIKDLQGEIDRHREELRESRVSYATAASPLRRSTRGARLSPPSHPDTVRTSGRRSRGRK
ncbi:hypothetical protein K1T71_012412 [Dendrolimus kikuchii]|uniref:Uncharacterized protein n=1 Tax=Dendrolimus kikuchii TaxID=765133 RepID=A0ACC1CJ94_9NEOP|nr:hypothetical protein K1T71_012412 [Dendrolimus kikuchii]